MKISSLLNVIKFYLGNTPLHFAALTGNVPILKLLINTNPNLDLNLKNTFGETPLYLASHRGHLEAVKYLLQLGSNINILKRDDTSPIWAAADGGHLEVLKELLGENPVDHQDQVDSSLVAASGKGFVDVVQFLVEGANANINYSNDILISPLLSACAYNRTGIKKLYC